MDNLHYKGTQANRALGPKLSRALKSSLPAGWRDRPVYMRVLASCPAIERADEPGHPGETLVWRWDIARQTLGKPVACEAPKAGAIARAQAGVWWVVANAYWSGDSWAYWLYLVAVDFTPPAPKHETVDIF